MPRTRGGSTTSIPPPLNPSLQTARDALRVHDYSVAVRRFNEYLETHPDDLEARLELGIALLMAGDDCGFYGIHHELEPVMDRRGRPAGRLARLWEVYCSMVRKAARAAAVVGLAALPLGLAGCPVDKPPPSTAVKPPPAAVEPDAGAGAPVAPMPDAAAPPPATQFDAALATRPVPVPKYGAVRPHPPPAPIRIKYGVVRPIRSKYKVVRPTVP